VLRLQVRAQLGEFALDAALEAPASGLLVVVGESGSGKTTLLRLLAGLLAPDAGRIELRGRVLADTATGAWLPPRERRAALVPQDYALFPHLDARDNVAFGPRARGMRGAAAHAVAMQALERLGVADLAARRPRELSGGQQQRVALARALATSPELLLLDEPLAALDPRTRLGVRAGLRAALAGLPCLTVFVTHSPADALALGDTIAVMEGGRVTQVGTRDDLLHRPRTRWVADLLGTNLLEVRGAAHDDGGLLRLAIDGGDVFAADDAGAGTPAFALVDPREIVVARTAPGGSARNVFRGAVLELLPEPPSGERVRVALATRPPLVAELTRGAVEQLALAPGDEVYAAFKATGVRVLR